MGALFGFTGPPDPDLAQALAMALRHRGPPTAEPEVHAGPQGTLGVIRPMQPHPRAQLPSAIYEIGGRRLAVSGIVSGWTEPDAADDITGLATHLKGAFVAAVTDLHSPRIHLIRDGAGRRTVYCARLGERWLFASEPKALHQRLGFIRRLRPGAVAQYLTFSFIPGPQTMLDGLWEVPSGHIAILDSERPDPVWSPHFLPEHQTVEPAADNDAAWIARFRAGFADAVEALRPNDDPVAVFLSGGIDSSIVTAQLCERRPGPVHTFAIHFGDAYANECEFARSVADYCGTVHEEVLIRPQDFVPRLYEIVHQLDEPIGDPVTMPNYELAARTADRGFRFVFNGEGGDPLFGGPKNVPMLLSHWYGGERSADFRERAYLASYRRAYDALDTLLTPEFRKAIDPDRDLNAVLRPFFTASQPARFLDKLIAINTRLKGAHLILPKVERMLGAWRLTPLSPLFDERLIELTFQLPGHLKLRNGVEKIILKRAFEGRLPQAIIDRPKSGMRVPVHAWFKDELARYARQLLNRRRIKADGIFQPSAVQQLLSYDESDGASRFGLRLWMLITFHIWKEQVLEA